MGNRRTTLALVALLSATSPSGATDEPSTSLAEIVEGQVHSVFDDWSVPGGVVSVVDGGEVIHRSAHGIADLESRVPVDFELTAFRLASLSKPVTAVAALRLVDRGELDLRAPLAPELPELDLDPRLHLEHLLTHTGGFEDRFLRRLTRDPNDLGSLHTYLGSDLPATSIAPGEVSSYSNHGLALAGLAVAEATGRPYEDAMRGLVFEPLGMSRSTFELGEAEQLAKGYRFGVPAPVYGIRTVPASMLVATGADMTRLLVALVDPSDAFLSPAARERMTTRHFGHHPAFTGRALGWSEDSSVTPRRLLHSGGTDGFSSAIVLIPERQGAVFVAFNGNAYVWDLVRAVLDRVFPATPSPPDEAFSAPGDLEPFRGRYVPAELPRSTLDKARRLFEQQTVGIDGRDVLLGGQRFAPSDHGLHVTEQGRRLAVATSTSGAPRLFTDEGAWTKLPWHADRRLHAVLLGLLLVATSLLVSGRPRGLLGEGFAPRLLRLAGTLQLLQFVALGVFMAVCMADDGGVLRFEIPLWFRALLFVPLATVGLGALGVWAARKTTAGPLYPLAAWATLVGWALFLHYWNLLGVAV